VTGGGARLGRGRGENSHFRICFAPIQGIQRGPNFFLYFPYTVLLCRIRQLTFHKSEMIIICNLHRCDICDDLLIPDANYLRTLDSSIKRNTTVIKKLKTINDEQKDGLMEELKSVNLSKFVSEAVSYICEAKLRSADIQAAVQVIYICNMIFFCYTLRKFLFLTGMVALLLLLIPPVYILFLTYMLIVLLLLATPYVI
jgi:hypothetical protein